MAILTLEQAKARRVSPNSLVAVAMWNESAAKIARSRKDQGSADRHINQARQLRDLAIELVQD